MGRRDFSEGLTNFRNDNVRNSSAVRALIDRRSRGRGAPGMESHCDGLQDLAFRIFVFVMWTWIVTALATIYVLELLLS